MLNKAQCISDTGQEGHLNQFHFIWILSLAIQPEFILANKSCEQFSHMLNVSVVFFSSNSSIMLRQFSMHSKIPPVMI